MCQRTIPPFLHSNGYRKTTIMFNSLTFFNLHLSISDGFVKTKIYDKRDDFDFDIVNFPFLDGDVPRSAS